MIPPRRRRPRGCLQDLPRRVRISDAHQTGFIAGAVLLSVLGSLAIASRPQTLSALGLVRGGRVRGRGCAAGPGVGLGRVQSLAAGPAVLVAVVLVVLYTATAHYVAALMVVVVLAALVLAWVVVALSPAIASPDTYSLPLRRLVGFVASGIDASLIPVIAYLVGLFAWVLNR